MEEQIDWENHGVHLAQAMRIWERWRIWYNIALLASGLLAIADFWSHLDFVVVAGCMMWGLASNAAFFLGVAIEAAATYWLGYNPARRWPRVLLFAAGLVFSAALTYVIGVESLLMITDPSYLPL